MLKHSSWVLFVVSGVAAAVIGAVLQQQPCHYYSMTAFNVCMPLSLVYTCLAHGWIFLSRNISNNNINIPKKALLPRPAVAGKKRKKVALITGSNTGIGFETANMLVVKYGWEVVLACRSRDKAIRAMERIRSNQKIAMASATNNQGEEGEGGRAVVLDRSLDLSDFSSVSNYAKEVQERYSQQKIDVLINNAGVNTSGKSKNGLDLLFQANFLGHFLLSNLLIHTFPKKADNDEYGRGGRIINLSSVMHHFAGSTPKNNVQFWKRMAAYHSPDEPSSSSSSPPQESNYAASKLAMILFSQEWNRRYYNYSGGDGASSSRENSNGSNGIRSIAVNPGSVASDIWRGYPAWLRAVFRHVYLSPEQGCIPVVAAAVIDDNDDLFLENDDDNSNSNSNLDGTYYLQPYWIPGNNNKSKKEKRPMIPFTEMMGPYVGYTATTPRLPHVNGSGGGGGAQEAKALWEASEELTMMTK